MKDHLKLPKNFSSNQLISHKIKSIIYWHFAFVWWLIVKTGKMGERGKADIQFKLILDQSPDSQVKPQHKYPAPWIDSGKPLWGRAVVHFHLLFKTFHRFSVIFFQACHTLHYWLTVSFTILCLEWKHWHSFAPSDSAVCGKPVLWSSLIKWPLL